MDSQFFYFFYHRPQIHRPQIQIVQPPYNNAGLFLFTLPADDMHLIVLSYLAKYESTIFTDK